MSGQEAERRGCNFCKQVTGLDRNSYDPPNPLPQEASPQNNEFPSNKRIRMPAEKWGWRSRHLGSGSTKNWDLPSSDMLNERECRLG